LKEILQGTQVFRNSMLLTVRSR